MVNVVYQENYSLESLRKITPSFWEGLSSSFFGVKVFIKPNLVVPVTKWEQASLTHINVVSLVIEELKDRGCSDIIVGDCGFKGQWDFTIHSSGYEKLPKKYGIQLIGLQEGENFHKFSLIRFPNKKDYLSLFGVRFSDYMLGSALIINISKLKVHKMALVTGAIKNMMGTMTQKGSMHPRANVHILHKRLRDLYFLIREKVKFCVMDGIVGSEYSEHYGIPKKVGVLISSTDMWETDCLASCIMGINPSEVPYLKLIQQGKREDFPFTQTIRNFERPLGWRKKI